VPSGANRLAKVPGVGQKRALQLAARGITTAGELEEALRRGRLRDLPGFGPKSEERIARGLGVAEGDTELREALQALPRNVSEDEIYAVLAAHIPGAAAADGNDQAPFGPLTSAGTCTRTPTSPTA
jgi:DNA polymerase/3'-5' exonuclease PolX